MFSSRLLQIPARTSRNSLNTPGIYRAFSVFQWGHDKNQTTLHTLMQTTKRVEEISQFINSHSSDEIVEMLLTVNVKGKTPLELFNENKILYSDDGFVLFTQLLELIDSYQKQIIKPLTHMVSANEMLDVSQSLVDEKYYENLQFACEVINGTRKIIKASATHPDNNYLSSEEKDKLLARIDKMRKKIKSATIHYNQDLLPQEIPHLVPEAVLSTCIHYEIGNCREKSYTSVELMKQLAKKELWVGVVDILNGDHQFLVWDTKPLESVKYYLHNDSNAIFQCAWKPVAGKFNVNEITNKMGDYKSFTDEMQGEYKNVIVKFNPDYHCLTYTNCYHIVPKKENALVTQIGLFSTEKNTKANVTEHKSNVSKNMRKE